MTRAFSNIQVHDMTRKTGYKGFFEIGAYTFSHDLFEGGKSETMTREVFERGRAAAVLPYDPETDSVLLIQQFLIGAHLAERPNRPFQVVAGMIEEGETGLEVARREAAEEAGIKLTGFVTPAQAFLPSPGGSSERIETFVAHADLSNAGGIFGLDEEHEDIRVMIFTADEAIAMLDAGEIEAGPAVVVLSWFARHRDDIRARWRQEPSQQTGIGASWWRQIKDIRDNVEAAQSRLDSLRQQIARTASLAHQDLTDALHDLNTDLASACDELNKAQAAEKAARKR